jgi:hypothetical protein
MKKNYEEIKHKNKLIAIIINSNYSSDKTVFFSPPSFSQQVGYLRHNKGGTIKAHFHKKVRREIILTQEVLFIKNGKIKIDLYTVKKEYITTRELNKGDVIFLCSGGHGFKILEDSEIIEVKQGPYSNREIDKELFDGV